MARQWRMDFIGHTLDYSLPLEALQPNARARRPFVPLSACVFICNGLDNYVIMSLISLMNLIAFSNLVSSVIVPKKI
jgi:hypothetical protein